MSHAKNKMNFLEGSANGEKPNGWELLEAGEKFSSIVNDEIIQHFPDTFVDEYVSDGEQVSKSLLHKKIDFEDDTQLRVDVVSKYMPDSNKTVRQIRLLEVDSDGRHRRMQNYVSEESGVVYRHDTDDIYEGTQREIAMFGGDSELGISARALAAHAQNEQKNAALEREMGLNHQPVGEKEIEQIQKLVEQAQPY